MTTKKARPELGELKPGQRVMVRRAPNDSRGLTLEQRYVPAVVVKAARVWIDLERVGQDGWPKAWRMRRDTQSEGSAYIGQNASFSTLDQHAWDQAQDRAFSVLRDHGIDLRSNSPWRGRETELADIISMKTTTDRKGNGS